MITLTIGNSLSKITGLSPQQEKELREELSYLVDAQAAYFAGSHRPRRKCLLTKQGEFPTGLWDRVSLWASTKGLGISVKDTRGAPPTPKVSLDGKFAHAPYPAQFEALHAALRHKHGIISMPTGSGKSNVIALITNSYSLRTLIIVPTVEIKKQLSDTLVTIFGTTPRIRVENIDSPSLKNATNFDVLIIDEAHHVAAKTYHTLNKTAWTGIYHRFFLTATAFRNNEEEMLLFEAIAGSIIYELSYKDAVANKYIVPVEAYYVESPKQENDCYTWAQTYSQLVVKNNDRNELIASLLQDLQGAGKATLCLVKEVAHGNALTDLTGIPFVNGQDEESRQYIAQFNRGENTALIGTSGILGEGVDTKPCEYVIIAGLGKAKSAFLQQVGRAIRCYPGKETAKVLLIKDRSHKYTLRHFNAQAKILKEYYGIPVIKLDV